MDSRIHACLNGELPREALSADEAARLARVEHAAGVVAEALRAHPVPDLGAAVMARLVGDTGRAAAPSPLARAWAWLWQPRELRLTLRPAWGAALAAACLLLLALPRPPREAPAPLAAAPASPTVFVQFRLQAPSAHGVALAGSFTGWKPSLTLRQTSPGVWSAVVPMRPGVHDYLFVVDGREWVPDPGATHVADGLGGVNSRVLVPSPLPAA